MEPLKKYAGVWFMDLNDYLDSYIINLENVPARQLIKDFDFLKSYYFDHNDDPGRLQPFIDRLKELQRQ